MSFTQFQTTDRVIDDRMNLFGNELISQITKYSTYDLYLKQANLMNTQKPTGAGSLITFANVTETEQLAFTFNYAIPEQLIISRDNRYNLVIPFEGLESNRSYIFRYVYTHEGTTIFDITRNAVTTVTGKFTAEFQALNQNDVDIIAEANSTVTLRIYVKTVAGTDSQISLLVNDVNTLGRLSRNEATAIISADNVLMPDGVTAVSSAIGQITHDIAQLSNPNLLINGDFQIWQRGVSFSSSGYTADRWRMYLDSNASHTISKDANGFKVTKAIGGTSNTCYISYNTDEYAKVVNKKRTLSVCVDGVVYSHTVQTTSLANIIFDLDTFTFSEAVATNTVIDMRTKSKTSLVINWIKLELGDIATPLSPRSYAEELAMCQRYFQIRSTNNVPTVDMRPLMRIASPTVGGTSGAYTYDAEIY